MPPLPITEHPPIPDGGAAQSPATGDHQAGYNPGLGLAILATGYVMTSLSDGVAKMLMTEISAGEMSWARYLFQGILPIPFVIAATGWRSLIPGRLGGNLARGVLVGVGSALMYIGLQRMPLADAVAIFFIQPFILTILAVIFEHEKVGWRRWLAIVIGFSGVLLVIQPSFAEFGLYALFPAASAACFACYLLLNRRLRDSGAAMGLQVFASLVGMLTLTALLGVATIVDMPTFAFTMPTLPQWAVFAGIGGVAGFAHYLIFVAFRYATPAVLAPMQYVQIISATAFGLIVFGDFPSPMKWLGIAIIIGCGIYIFLRETRLRTRT